MNGHVLTRDGMWVLVAEDPTVRRAKTVSVAAVVSIPVAALVRARPLFFAAILSECRKTRPRIHKRS